MNWIDIDSDHLQNAVALSKLSIDEDPENGEHWLDRGYAFVRAADYDNAIKCLIKEDQLNAPSVTTDLLLTIAYAKTGNRPVALQHYDQAKGEILFGDAFRLYEIRRLRDEARAALE